MHVIQKVKTLFMKAWMPILRKYTMNRFRDCRFRCAGVLQSQFEPPRPSSHWPWPGIREQTPAIDRSTAAPRTFSNHTRVGGRIESSSSSFSLIPLSPEEEVSRRTKEMKEIKRDTERKRISRAHNQRCCKRSSSINTPSDSGVAIQEIWEVQKSSFHINVTVRIIDNKIVTSLIYGYK